MYYVALIEDDKLILNMLVQLIDASENMKVSWAHSTAELALNETLDIDPDVILVDIDLPGISGIEALPKLKIKFSQSNMVMLTVNENSDMVLESLKLGAVGYLLKEKAAQHLEKSIEEVCSGGAPMSPSIARNLISSFQQTNEQLLTERELEVLQKLCNGSNNQNIAEELFISVNTVKAHIKNVYEKLHVHNRAEVVSAAIKKKLI